MLRVRLAGEACVARSRGGRGGRARVAARSSVEGACGMGWVRGPRYGELMPAREGPASPIDLGFTHAGRVEAGVKSVVRSDCALRSVG